MTSTPDEFARQRALDTYRVVDTLPELAFDDITRLASILCDAPIALVSLIDRDRQWFKSRLGIELMESKRQDAICNHAIQTPGQLLEVRDAREDSRFADNPFVAGAAGIRFYAGMPLVTPGGAPIGTVCVLDREARALTDDQRAGLASLARLTMNLLEARHRERELEREISLAASVAARPAPATQAPDATLTISESSGYTIAVFEVQGLAAALDSLGHRAVERAMMELQAGFEARLRPGSGDTVSHVADSPEMTVVLQGRDGGSALRALTSYVPRFESETSFRVVWGAADSVDDNERPERVFLRADKNLSVAKDRFRSEMAAARSA